MFHSRTILEGVYFRVATKHKTVDRLIGKKGLGLFLASFVSAPPQHGYTPIYTYIKRTDYMYSL